MTNKEAIKRIKAELCENCLGEYGKSKMFCPKGCYRKTAIEAIEKQIPKEPFMWGDGYADGEIVIEDYECPNCGAVYEIDEKFNCCPNCGQKLDWSSEDDI